MNSICSRAIVFAFALNLGLILVQDWSVVRAAQSNWEREAEETFRLGRGAGRRLMTQEEWRNHQREMKGLSEKERERYREQWHEKMMERARQKNIDMPDSPGPQPGPGPGGPIGPAGPGGAGKGRGGR